MDPKDILIENTVELGGTDYRLVEPQNLTDLSKALELKNMISTEISALMNDEDSTSLQEKLDLQKEYIAEYTKTIGSFDNSIFINNLAFLLHKYKIRISDLEDVVGVSPGYISRTAKENTSKRISVDVLWKIAKVFNTDIKILTSYNLGTPNTNSKISETFVQKLNEQTINGNFEWVNHGGSSMMLDKRYIELGLVSETEDGPYIYHPSCYNKSLTWILTSDIMAIKNFKGNKSLAIIRFNIDDDNLINRRDNFDFIMIWTDEEGSHYQKLFSSDESPFSYINEYTEELMNNAMMFDEDTPMTSDVRNMLIDYIKEDK